MKKILISIIIILLLVLSYFIIWHGIGIVKISSVNDIKYASEKLDEDFAYADELASQRYPNKCKKLDEAITSLKTSKKEYESKNKYNTGDGQIGAVEIKNYKIHYLWTILGNYKEEENLKSLNIDLKTTDNKDIYDLQFTLVGSYVGITDYLYDIENDENLKFEIKKLNISPYTTTITKKITVTEKSSYENSRTESTTPFKKITEITTSALKKAKSNTMTDETKEDSTTIYDPKWVEVTFVVENVGVTLD